MGSFLQRVSGKPGYQTSGVVTTTFGMAVWETEKRGKRLRSKRRMIKGRAYGESFTLAAESSVAAESARHGRRPLRVLVSDLSGICASRKG
jgi:hypothetical protein